MRAKSRENLSRIMALESEVGGGGPLSGGVEQQFIVDPTATTAENVYQTLALAAAAANTVSGNVTYVFRGSQTVPSGAYNLAPAGGGLVFFQGSSSSERLQAGFVSVTFADGAQITAGRPAKIERMAVIVAAAATPVIDVASGTYLIEASEGLFFPTGAAPFIRASGGNVTFESNKGWSVLTGGGPSISCTGAGTVNVNISEGSLWQSNTVARSAGTVNMTILDGSPSGDISTTQVGAINLNIPLQKFTVTLTGTGVSAAIPCVLNGGSIVCSLKTPAGAGAATTTSYSALNADRVNGFVTGALGSFKVTAQVAASSGPNATDTSVVDVLVYN